MIYNFEIDNLRDVQLANSMHISPNAINQEMIVCYVIPKCASSSLKYMLGITSPDLDSSIGQLRLRHTPELKGLKTNIRFSFRGPRQSPYRFNFCFARNPYARAFSTYQMYKTSKHAYDNNYKPHNDAIGLKAASTPVHRRIENRHLHAALDGTFDEWIASLHNYVKSTHQKYSRHVCALNIETHLLPQVAFLPTVPLDFVGKVETFEADWQELHRRLKLFDPSRTYPICNKILKTGPVSIAVLPKLKLPKSMTRKTAGMIYDLYEEDFLKLGYDPYHTGGIVVW